MSKSCFENLNMTDSADINAEFEQNIQTPPDCHLLVLWHTEQFTEYLFLKVCESQTIKME